MIWPFRKQPSKPATPTVPEPPEFVTVRFVPQPDITAPELAHMLSRGMWYAPYQCERALWEAIPDHIRRHLPLQQ